MKLKHLTGMGVALNIMLIATSANAFSSYLTDVNTVYGSNYTNCLVCHSTAGGGTDKGVTAYANMYRTSHSAATVRNQDADADGYTNGQEASVNADMSNATSSPFTIAAAATAITDTVLPNFVVKGDAAATAQAFTDPYSLAIAGSTQIIGNESLTINNAPVDIYHKSSGVDTSMTLYMVDPYGQGTVSPMGTGWTANADGSLHIVALPSGVTSITGVMVRSVPTTATTTTTPATTTPITTTGENNNENDSENDGSSSTGVGCVTAELSTPLMMFFAMLSLVFVVRRKNS